jgi:hypothetical protein
MVTRTVCDGTTDETGAITRALGLMVDHSAAGATAVLAVPAQADLKDTTLTAVLGDDAAQALRSSGQVIWGDRKLILLTERKRPVVAASWSGVALVVYPTEKILDEVERLLGLQVVIVMADRLESAKRWVAAHSPATILADGGARQPAPAAALSLLVEEALRCLHRNANSGGQLNHPTDKARAQETLLLLRAAGEPVDGAAIRAFVVGQLGWRAKDGDALEQMVDRTKGKRLKRVLGGPYWADDIVEQWRTAISGRK